MAVAQSHWCHCCGGDGTGVTAVVAVAQSHWCHCCGGDGTGVTAVVAVAQRHWCHCWGGRGTGVMLAHVLMVSLLGDSENFSELLQLGDSDHFS